MGKTVEENLERLPWAQWENGGLADGSWEPRELSAG